jgi:prevent-host-death family protein
MNMKTITARDAKTRFGELLDTAQREPVVITKNNRPVSVVVSIHDIMNPLLHEMFLPEEEGYDAFFRQRVETSLQEFRDGRNKATPLDESMKRLRQRLQEKAKLLSVK